MILVFLILFLSLVPTAHATNYPELSVEERIRQLTDSKIIASQQAQDTQDTNGSSDAFEQEKKTISQQLAIISGDEDTKYIIVPGDTLQVSYSDQGNIVENIYQVNSDGTIPMPLIGEVKVTGMNRGQAREFLNGKMSEYIREPKLQVLINTAGKYTVLGAAGPGVYPLQPNLRLMEALIKAGIQQGRANLANVLIFRAGKDKPQMLKLNVKKMMLKGDLSDNIPIKPNDLIYVPDTFLFNIEAFKDKLFEYITDYYTFGGATILKSSATKGF